MLGTHAVSPAPPPPAAFSPPACCGLGKWESLLRQPGCSNFIQKKRRFPHTHTHTHTCTHAHTHTLLYLFLETLTSHNVLKSNSMEFVVVFSLFFFVLPFSDSEKSGFHYLNIFTWRLHVTNIPLPLLSFSLCGCSPQPTQAPTPYTKITFNDPCPYIILSPRGVSRTCDEETFSVMSLYGKTKIIFSGPSLIS